MKKFLFIIFLILLIGSGFIYYLFFSSITVKEDLRLNIALGSAPSVITKQLKELALIHSEKAFLLTLKFLNKELDLKAGNYVFLANSTWSMFTLIDYLQSGQLAAEQWFLQLKEGETIFELKDYLQTQEIDLSDWDKLIKIKEWQNYYSFLREIPEDNSLEGFLFPDTYYFEKFTSLDQILKTLLTHFEIKTAEFRQLAQAKNLTWYDILRLASIVEWEVRTPINRALVADIFWRRYHDKYLLQSDATLNYLRVKNERIASNSYKDLENESPYNTYKYIGLPPTPINNPSLGAIEAVINPKNNDYYYFVTSLTGNIYYAKTYEEHLSNIQKAKNDK